MVADAQVLEQFVGLDPTIKGPSQLGIVVRGWDCHAHAACQTRIHSSLCELQ